MACSSGVKRSTARRNIEKPSIVQEGWLSCDRFVADVAASPCGNPPCPVRQVGEGVSPTLDADGDIGGSYCDVERPKVLQPTRLEIGVPGAPINCSVIALPPSEFTQDLKHLRYSAAGLGAAIGRMIEKQEAIGFIQILTEHLH